MNSKFEFTRKTKEVVVFRNEHDGFSHPVQQTVYQVRLVKDIHCRGGKLTKGTLGGYIENENSLGHDDSSWLCEDSVICNGAEIAGDTFINQSRIEGDIFIMDSLVYDSFVQCKTPKHLLQSTVMSKCTLEHMEILSVRGGKLNNIFSDGENDGKISTEGVELLNLRNFHIDVSGTATFDSCSQGYGMVKGNDVHGTFKNVQFANQTSLSGHFELTKSRLDNVSFRPREHYMMKNVSVQSKEHFMFSRGLDWEDVTLVADKLLIHGETKFKNLYARNIVEFNTAIETEISNVFIEKRSQLLLDGHDPLGKIVLAGMYHDSKKKTGTQGIRIASECLFLIDSNLTDDVSIRGKWNIVSSTMKESASLHSETEFIHNLSDSTMTEFSSIRIDTSKFSETLENVHLIGDDCLSI